MVIRDGGESDGDGWMDGRMDERMNEWVEGRIGNNMKCGSIITTGSE